MGYKNPIGRYRAMKKRGPASRNPGKGPHRTLQCGQGLVFGDERYCSACGKRWPKDERHP